jgi:hypothetical protein
MGGRPKPPIFMQLQMLAKYFFESFPNCARAADPLK